MPSLIEQLKPPAQPVFCQTQQKWLEDFVANLQGHYELQIQNASDHNQKAMDDMKAAYKQLQEGGKAQVQKEVKETLVSLGLLGPSQTQSSQIQPGPHLPLSAAPNLQPLDGPPILPPSFHPPATPSDQDSHMHAPVPPSPSPSASSSRSRKTSITSSSETFMARANGNRADPPGSARQNPGAEPSPSSASQPNPGSSSGTSHPNGSEKKPIEFMTEFLSSISPVKRKRKAAQQKPLKEKKPSEEFRIRKGELEPDQELLQVWCALIMQQLPADVLKDAFFLWVRVIWGILTKTALPSLPTTDELLVFNTHMKSIQQLNEVHTTKGKGLIPESMVNLDNRASFHFNRGTSKNARNASRLPNTFLQHTAGQLARYGMVRWCPDLRFPHDCLYNKACQYIAIDTFQSGLVQGAFNFLGCTLRSVEDIGLLTQIYHHIVFHYFYEVWVTDGRKEGQYAKAAVNNAIYRDRARRSENRLKFMVENRYPPRYQVMCDTKATSEDEMDPLTKQRWRKRKPERSEAAEIFIRLLEAVMKRQAQADGKPWVDREPHPLQAETSFITLPMGMPLDYYSPETWKTLTPAQRYKALLGCDGKGRPKIAFLPEPTHSFGQGDETSATLEKLSDDEFFNLRSETVFPLYNFDLGDLSSSASQEDDMQV
ncbi:hypothetical protein AAF712_013929 [Marasmius tenuissimus]|uniref:Uncharacterized protein n=1 Tax=Marasmius tenuissimus TaxID=585030 RepID=A0ABR2ZDE2_9AGAR